MHQQSVEIKQIASSVRFVRGYRYLDRCGESVLKLQDTLDEGWIPGELTANSGNLVNHTLGMSLQFNSDSFALSQSGEFIDFNYFEDQSCKTFDVLRRLLEIPAIIGPSLQVIFQRGFDSIDEAEDYLCRLDLVMPSARITQILGGKQTAMSAVFCSEDDTDVSGSIATLRKRLEIRSIRQERQPAFDERLMQRTRLLPEDQRKAMMALMSLRRRHRELHPAAAQITCEFAYESEIKSEIFELKSFYDLAWNWCDSTKTLLPEKK